MYIITTEGRRINYLLALSHAVQEENFHCNFNFAVTNLSQVAKLNSVYIFIL